MSWINRVTLLERRCDSMSPDVALRRQRRCSGFGSAMPNGGSLQFEAMEDRTVPAFGGPLQIVLVADNVPHAGAIAGAATPGTAAVIYRHDAMTTRGIVDQVEAISREHGGKEISRLALVAHGNSGRVAIGGRAQWNAASIAAERVEWNRLGELLAEDSVIDLYACSVSAGEAGRRFVHELAAATGAAVNASDNAVGNVPGSDLIFEFSTAGVRGEELLSAEMLASTGAFSLLSVNLTYPDSGTFAIGQVIHITGTASDASGISHSGFELYKGGVSPGNLIGSIFVGAPGSGATTSYNWRIPATLNGHTITGGDYKIRMVAWANSPPGTSGGDFSAANLVIEVSTARVGGIDVSHWQGTINWVQVSNAGVGFVFMKATEGRTYQDPRYTQNRAGAMSVGIVHGAYHYARPENNTAIQEANWFVSVAGGSIGEGFLPPVVDVEGNALNLPSATLSAWVKDFCDHVQLLTGFRPMLYASQGYLTYINQDPNTTDLWVARYNGQNPQTGSPGNVSPWPANGWKVWQYTSTGSVPGITGNVDLNVFNGPYSAMYSWLNGIWDKTAPKVTGVSFDSSSWTASFRAAAGDPSLGFAAQTGAMQLTPLPWSNINTIAIRFSEPVVVTMASLQMRGLNVANYAFSGFHYDAESNVARWTLSGAIDTDKVLLDLDGDGASAVKDLAGNKLAGSWTEGVSTFPTSGAAGQDFLFRFVVAVGDVDRNGIVRNADLNAVRNNVFVDAGQAGYNIFHDVDGNGQIRNADVNAVRARLFQDPPSGSGPFRNVRFVDRSDDRRFSRLLSGRLTVHRSAANSIPNTTFLASVGEPEAGERQADSPSSRRRLESPPRVDWIDGVFAAEALF